MEALRKALAARTQAGFDSNWPDAEAEVEAIFTTPTWGVSGRADPFTEANLASLWRNELSEPVRTALEKGGVDPAAYGVWLGELHYVYVSAYLESLFDRYQENKGWRVLAISFPALNAAAVGIASHYQQAQNHNRLGEVSNLLFDHAQAELGKREIDLPGRKVTGADWDGDGLVPAETIELAGASLPVGQQIKLKYVRTTTVKKILASFINIQPIDLGAPQAGQELRTTMEALKSAAQALA